MQAMFEAIGISPTVAIGAALVALVGILATLSLKSGSSSSASGLDSVGADPKARARRSSSASDGGDGVPLMIFFGSETGTAEEYSKNLALEAPRHGFKPHVVDLEHFVPEMLTGELEDCDDETKARVAPMVAESGPLAVFLMATCGEGDVTNNARNFVTWITGDDGEKPTTSKLRYTVFGLGNTGYEHYNEAAKITQAALEGAGASIVVKMGLGDDDGDLESDFADWQKTIWAPLRRAVAAELGLEEGTDDAEEDGPACALPVKSVAPFKVVEVPPPAGVTAADTERDDLVGGRADEAHAASGGIAAASPAGGGWLDSEPMRCLTRRQLMAMGRGADPVRVRWFQAVPARVSARREVRGKTSLGGSTAHVELDVGAAGLTYGTADDAAVLPENPAEAVDAMCAHLGLDAAQWFTLEGDAIAPAIARAEAARGAGGAIEDPAHATLKPGERPPPFPVPCTVGRALQRYCDLGGLPSKALAGQMAHWAEKEDERARLARLVSTEGRSEWDEFVRTPRRSVLELFQAFPSVRPPLAELLHVLPPLKPREYTIASSPLAHPGSMHLAVSVLNEPKPPAPGSADAPGRRLAGVCSTFLAGGTSGATPAPEGAVVRVYVRKSTFKMPESTETPIVMVGPGTGLAPMRAFCQEREARAAAGEALGEALLFFGCRREEEDYIYRDELEAWAASGVISDLHLAFSRQGAEKVYVQHRLREQGAKVWALLSEQGAHVYVCGATAMGKDVTAALAGIAADHGGMSAAEATAYVAKLEKDHRLVQELWS
ncbi:hypothetical protein FNF27_01853 [Cafeteria roenbergensis]|uniref:NADPH--hemoprotein reductase n=1 Tax=Cafeteria roenbergensis TaxID=33653 RepID=A0A5A8DVP5_CAFRO|nr:hypothetical protein FNF28_02696 [Cafeteria roenbergensis]KAA0169007.1 hypothetical protein FNF31_00167 [Cafeteria roenbergensis]KAA0176572.1 hypothetical protein FNF27_01853 [Cafeteria roenbergensis]